MITCMSGLDFTDLNRDNTGERYKEVMTEVMKMGEDKLGHLVAKMINSDEEQRPDFIELNQIIDEMGVAKMFEDGYPKMVIEFASPQI